MTLRQAYEHLINQKDISKRYSEKGFDRNYPNEIRKRINGGTYPKDETMRHHLKMFGYIQKSVEEWGCK